MDKFFVSFLQFFHILGPSLWEQGYENNSIIVYSVAFQDSLIITDFSTVIRRVANARKEAFLSNKKAFVFSAKVDTHFLFDATKHGQLYYLGPDIQCKLEEIYLK